MFSTWNFKCIGPHGQDLCFNGGTCEYMNRTTIIEERCKCPEGFQADNDWFHFPNCVRPVDVGMNQFIVFATLFGLELVYFWVKVKWTLRKDLVYVGWIMNLHILFVILFSFGFFIDNGCGVTCAVFGNLSFLCADFLCAKVILMTLSPLYAMRKKSFDTFRIPFYGFTILTAIMCVGSGIAMAVLTNDPEWKLQYNIAAFVSAETLWIGGIIQLGFMMRAASLLRSELNNSAKLTNGVMSPQHTALLVRLRSLQVGGIFAIFPYVILTLMEPVVITIISSFPYAYYVTYIQMSTVVCFFGGFMFFLKHPPSKLATESQVSGYNSGGS